LGIKLIHTSDLHLSERKPNTLKALDEILRIAKRKKVDILTISGDLFESKLDAVKLRPLLREKFSGNGFPIIVIPGNHDIEVYEESLDFGDNFVPLTRKPFDVYSHENVNFIAIPYVENLTSDVLSLIQNQTMKDKINILLLHCTLDIGYCIEDFGDETRYCPISKAMLVKLSYDFILSGHFHKKTDIKEISPSSFFIYPGSPTSLSQKELGKRNVVFLDFEKNIIEEINLKTFYYDKLFITVTPGKEKEAILKIDEWLRKQIIEVCLLEIHIDGFIQVEEKDFRSSLPEDSDRVKVFRYYKEASIVLKHPLYTRFQNKLSEMNLSTSEEIETIVIEAISELITTGKVRL